MPTTTTLPNGQVLTSSALQPSEIEIIMQRLTAQALGIWTTDAATDWTKVRLEWQADGQPSWSRTEDIAFLRVVPEDVSVFHPRDTVYAPPAAPAAIAVTESTKYTNVWRTHWTFYGPNAVSRARLVASVMRMDFAYYQLAATHLYAVMDFATPGRVGEPFQGQYFERSDLSIVLNEGVVDTIDVGTVESIGVTLDTQAARFSGYGTGGYGEVVNAGYTQITTTTQIEVD